MVKINFERAMALLPDAADAACARAAALIGPDSLVFPIFTDLHEKSEDGDYVKFLSEALRCITTNLDCDAVVDLGDNFEVLGRKYHNSNEELTLLGEQMLDRIGGAAKCPVIHVHGNHDGIGTDFFKPEFWNGIAKSRNHAGAVYADAGSYFYVDIDKSSTRLVALSLPSDSELDTEYPTPVWAFGKKQLDWLKDTALDTEKNVILLIHVPFYYRYEGDEDPKISTWDGKRVRESYVSALCGFIDDLDEAVSALTEFKSRGRGRLVAALSGHTHRDFLFEPFDGDNGNPLPCHQAVTAATCFSTDDEARFCFAIDIAIWTPSAGELSLIRLGDGEDRRIKL